MSTDTTAMPPGWTGERSGEVEAILGTIHDPCHDATDEARDTAVRLEGEVHRLHGLVRTYLTAGTWADANGALEALGDAAGLRRARPGYGGAPGRWVPKA